MIVADLNGIQSLSDDRLYNSHTSKINAMKQLESSSNMRVHLVHKIDNNNSAEPILEANKGSVYGSTQVLASDHTIEIPLS